MHGGRGCGPSFARRFRFSPSRETCSNSMPWCLRADEHCVTIGPSWSVSLALGYDNTTCLTVQNRMCPEILRLTNQRFYEGRLTCGPHAPRAGRGRVRDVAGREQEDGTSYYNLEEVGAIQKICEDREGSETSSLVVLCPYVAQGRRILSRRLGVAVHTIDSFQGREADTVVLSMVRDGSSGLGFWSDHRRLVVALTRARRRLVVVVSNRATSWSNLGLD